MRISRVSKNKDFKNWLAENAGDEAAGKVNNISSIIAKDLVPEWVMPHWKEMKRKLDRDEGAESWECTEIAGGYILCEWVCGQRFISD